MLLLLVGCGGGGGADSPAPAPAPVAAPPSAPPVGETSPADLRLALNPGSARSAFELAFAMTDLGVSLSRVALELLTARLRAGGLEALVGPCESGGNITMAVDDLDRSGALSAGDLVTAAFDACASPDGRIDGALRIRVAAVSNTNAEQLRRGTVEIVRFVQTEGPDVLTLRGGIGFAFLSTAAEDRLDIDAADLASTLAGRSEAISGFTYRFTSRQNGGGYDTAAAGTIRSETLPGTFSFTQPSSWRGQAGQWPTAGAVSIAGRNGASARLDQFDASVSGSLGRVALQLDLDANGSFEVSEPLPWIDLVDAEYFSPVLRDPATPRPTSGAVPPVTSTPGTSPLAPPLPVPGFVSPMAPTAAVGRQLGLPVGAQPGGAVFDPRRNRVYLSDPFGNRVVVLSADTWLPIDTFGVGSSPRGLALSSTADELYVALGQGGAVAVVGLGDRSLRRAELEAALDTTEASQVAELRSGKLLVSAGNGALATIDLNDSLRVRAIPGLPALPRAQFEFSADRRVGYALAEGSTGRIAKLDLTATEPIAQFARDLAGTGSGVLSQPGDRMVLGIGSVVDTTSLTLLERGALGGSVGRTADYSRMLLTGSPMRLVDGTTLGVLESFSGGCPASAEVGVLSLGQRGEWLVYGPAGQCVFSTTTPASAPGVDGARTLSLPPEPTARNGRAIAIAAALSEPADDLALDDAGGLVYVSLPSPGQVAVVSLASNTVLTRINVGAEPRRLSLSEDRRWLYVALVGSGEVAVVDTATRLVQARIALGATLGTNLIEDIAEIRPDAIVVAARAADGSAVPLVEANRSAPHSPQRVGAAAGYRRAGLLISPDRSRMFVVENGGPRIVEARNLLAPGYPVVLTSRPRDAQFSGFGAISAEGDRLFLGGEVLSAATLTRLGVAGSARPVIPSPASGPAAGAFHGASDGFVTGYDRATFQRAYSARLVCPESPLIGPGFSPAIGFEITGRVVYSTSRDEFVMLQPSVGALCVVARQ